MKRFVPLLVMIVVALLVAADTAAVRDDGGRLGPSTSPWKGEQVATVAPTDCSFEALAVANPTGFDPEPIDNCPPDNRCHTASDCPAFHPIGCVWVCLQRCCVLDCT